MKRTANISVEPERRRIERRVTTASPFSHYRLLGRRRRLRRHDDPHAAMSPRDWYQTRLLVTTVAILFLCILDAYNTLRLLQIGAKEINPLMDVLIRQSDQLFVMGKFFLTGLGMIVLVAYHNQQLFRRLVIRHALYGILIGYSLLVGYQLSMFPGSVSVFATL